MMDFLEQLGILISFVVVLYLVTIVIGYVREGTDKVMGRESKYDITMNDIVSEHAKVVTGLIDSVAAATGNKLSDLRRKKIELTIIDPSMDEISKLKDLAQLKQDGIITEQEFQLLKKEIIDKLYKTPKYIVPQQIDIKKDRVTLDIADLDELI